MAKGQRTPWGQSQSSHEWAPGIVFHSTAGHGGIHLSRERAKAFKQAHPHFVNWLGSGVWFEEDCDACAVIYAFADEIEAAKAAQSSPEKAQEWIAKIKSYVERDEYFRRQGFFGPRAPEPSAVA